MSDHDILGSEAMNLKRHIEAYVDEYDPPRGHHALVLIAQLVMAIDKFPDDEPRSI